MLSQLQASVALPPGLLSALLFPGALLRNAITAYQTKAPFVHPSLSTVLEEYNLAATPGDEGTSPAPIYRMEVCVWCQVKDQAEHIGTPMISTPNG